MQKLILASASPRRRELMAQAGLNFTVQVSEADETVTERRPDKIVEELALRKAMAVAETVTGSTVIGADTIVAMDGTILGKPGTREQAAEMLRMLSGKTHQVYTGVAILAQKDGQEIRRVFSERTDVTFYPVEEDEINRYVATGEPMDKAGAYGIQGRAAIFVREIHGDYNNVVGLPAARMYQELKSMGLLA